MKPLFISCIEQEVQLDDIEIINEPVNISLCTNIAKVSIKTGTMKEALPAIIFNGLSTEWIYPNEKLRDDQYRQITDNEFLKTLPSKKVLLNNLLELCTPGQLDMFNRMYPNGPKNIDLAISQIKRTILKLNEEVDNLRLAVKNNEEYRKWQVERHNQLECDILARDHDLAVLEHEIERLKASSSVDVKTAEILERLEWLDCLESAGVDNWSGYDYAVELLNGEHDD
jgi:hypothetical protein